MSAHSRHLPTECRPAQHIDLPANAPPGPEGAIISDERDGADRLAVVYKHGDTPPTITITEADCHVQMVHADGVVVAIIGSATGPSLSAQDVMLVERYDGVRKQ